MNAVRNVKLLFVSELQEIDIQTLGELISGLDAYSYLIKAR